MRVIPLISLMVVAAAPAAHAEDDWQLLRNVAAAGRQQALNGTYLHQMNGTLETFHIVRRAGRRYAGKADVAGQPVPGNHSQGQ